MPAPLPRAARVLLPLAAAGAAVAVASPPAGAAAPLRLSPPALSAPQQVEVTSRNRDLRLDPRRDYVVRMPSRPLEVPYGLQITGGRNVVLVGGHIRVPHQGRRPNGRQRRALYLKDQRGTIHVEGLLIDGPDVAEGINLDQRRGARVQLANVRVVGLRARDNRRFTDAHPDVLQTWAGPAELHVDGLTGTSNYQGFFLDPTKHGPLPRLFSFRRVDLSATTSSGYLLWRARPVPTVVDDVWVQPDPTKSEWVTMWPNPGAWPGVRVGRPPGGDFVPAGSAGVGYRSPGYAAAAERAAPPPTGREDVARNRAAIASSTYPASALPRNAVDGDPRTRWASPHADRHWWQVDLGAVRRIDEVRVDWERAFASRYRISTSADGARFSTAAEATIGRPGPATTRFAPRSARYVRIAGLRRATRWGTSFWDVQVLGPRG